MTRKLEEMEKLFAEKNAVQAAIEEALERETEMRVKFQTHSQLLEKLFLSLEKKIEELSSSQ